MSSSGAAPRSGGEAGCGLQPVRLRAWERGQRHASLLSPQCGGCGAHLSFQIQFLVVVPGGEIEIVQVSPMVLSTDLKVSQVTR
jgi:hypothetical protein